jgi:hypothetical protein
LIVAEAPLGLVTIFYQAQSEDTQEAFHVRFIRCDTHGHFNRVGTVIVGSYEDLNTSLNVAASVYGVRENGWEPTSVEELRHSQLKRQEVGRNAHQAIDTSNEFSDSVSADVFAEISQGVDKWHGILAAL